MLRYEFWVAASCAEVICFLILPKKGNFAFHVAQKLLILVIIVVINFSCWKVCGNWLFGYQKAQLWFNPNFRCCNNVFLSIFFSLKIGPSCQNFSATWVPARRKFEKIQFFQFFCKLCRTFFQWKNERYGPRQYQIFFGEKNSHWKIFFGGCPSCCPCCSEDMATWQVFQFFLTSNLSLIYIYIYSRATVWIACSNHAGSIVSERISGQQLFLPIK